MLFAKLINLVKLLDEKSLNLIDSTLDKNGLYFLSQYNPNIIFSNYSLTTSKTIFNNIFFSSICYDSIDNCFWVSKKYLNKLYKLNKNLNIISTLNICQKNTDLIKNLCYNEDNNTIILTFKNKILEINKNGTILNIFDNFNFNFNHISSLYFNHNIYCLSYFNKQYYILIINSDGITNFYKLPVDILFKSIIDIKYQSSTLIHISLLSESKSYSFISCIQLNISNIGNFSKSKYDIIHSIAMKEVRLSLILYQEGKKIQNVSSNVKNIDELIKLNRYLNKILTNIIVLENLLYSNLQLILDKDIHTQNLNNLDTFKNS